MLQSYPAIYTDPFSTEETRIDNDGRHLWMKVRGILFRGKMLDDWEPMGQVPKEMLASFRMDRNELREYTLKFPVPITLRRDAHSVVITLQICFQVGDVNERGMLNSETVQLGIALGEEEYQSQGKHGWFEDELNHLQAQLPDGYLIQTCINCAFSDYSPAGFGAFGCLACFRDCKEEYLSRQGKEAFFALQDSITEFVQEIHCCPEFEPRKPGTGYRG